MHRNAVSVVVFVSGVLWLYWPLMAAEPKSRDTLTGHTEPIVIGQFSPDGKWLATGARDSSTRLWDLASGKSSVIGGRAIPGELFFSTDSQTLVLTSGIIKEIQVCDVATRKCTTLPKQGRPTLAFSPDGKTQLFADGVEGKLRELEKPFDISTGGKTVTLTGAVPVHHGKHAGYLFSPDGKTLAIKDKERNVMLWDVASGTSKTLPQSAGMWFSFGAQGALLAAECGTKSKSPTGTRLIDNPSIKIFSVATGRSTPPLVGRPTDPPISESLVFSPNSKTAASCSTKTINLWDTTTGRLLGTFDKPVTPVFRLVFSPDGTTLAGLSSQGEVTLWGVASPKIIAQIKVGSTLLAFSPDGKTLAVCDKDSRVQLYDVPGK